MNESYTTSGYEKRNKRGKTSADRGTRGERQQWTGKSSTQNNAPQ
jgi:hypothetical protein